MKCLLAFVEISVLLTSIEMLAQQGFREPLRGLQVQAGVGCDLTEPAFTQLVLSSTDLLWANRNSLRAGVG